MSLRIIRNTYIRSLVSLTILVFVNFQVSAQGQFLRGVEKTEYILNGAEADFYVSPAGNDKWSGKLAEPNKSRTDGPFATLGKAKAAVTDLKREIYKLKRPAVEKRFIGTPHKYGTGRDILILIRNGIYSLDSALEFSASDGGERVETDLPTGAFEYHELKDYYVTYAAYPGESPVISGGEQIKGWKKKGRDKWITTTDLQEVKELYANGKRLTLARTPNSGYFLTDGQPSDSLWFNFYNGDIRQWKDLDNSIIHMVVRWGSVTTGLKKIDTGKRTAWLSDISPDIMIIPPKYYIENIEELLDTAGEWYFNRKEKTISIFPAKEITDPNSASIIFPKLDNLILVSGTGETPVRNLRFYNLSFENTLPGGGGTILFKYARNCEFLRNRIENVSQTAIIVGRGCYHNFISHNLINDAKGSGIVVGGDPKPGKWDDVVSDNTVSYNKITNLLVPATGISTQNALRTIISHNYVYNTGGTGISLGGWPNIEETVDGNHLAEYNNVSFTNTISDDEGGISVYGLSPGSVVRNNLIHDVTPARTNENVGFFFQNMASGWTVTDNIFYNLKQGEMKLCACYLVDNVYSNNFITVAPVIKPEDIIDGNPNLLYKNTEVKAVDQYITGSEIAISATILNNGSTGTAAVSFYVDGKIANSMKIPVIAGNERKIEFKYTFFDPGKHTVSIGDAPSCEVFIKGDPLFIIYSDLQIPLTEIPSGDSIQVSFKAQNVRAENITKKVELIIDDKCVAVKEITFFANEKKQISFSCLPETGYHNVNAGNLKPAKVYVYPVRQIDIPNSVFLTYCSTTALPCKFDYDQKKNHFEITASGSDFLHAEDSYGTIYLDDVIEGDFVAQVKVMQFSEGISEWFRAGIFVRNDLTKRAENKDGTLGSFLLFSTTKRCGAQWDEFGDGCMHNTKSKNYGIDNPLPVWLKLIRQGNRFIGYYSIDGKEWILSRESGVIPGLAKKIDIGLAGGANDQRPSTVIFNDLRIVTEKKGNY